MEDVSKQLLVSGKRALMAMPLGQCSLLCTGAWVRCVWRTAAITAGVSYQQLLLIAELLLSVAELLDSPACCALASGSAVSGGTAADTAEVSRRMQMAQPD